MSFNLEPLGRWSSENEFKVEIERAKAYAAATNDDNPKHASGELAPPLFAVVPVFETNPLAEVAAGIVPAEYAMQVLHGEQDIVIHRPIQPGNVVRVRGTPIGVHVKKSGTTVVAKTETRDQDGQLLNEQYFVTFYRGATEGEGAGEEAPAHRFPEEVRSTEPVASVTYKVDLDQTYRYAEASGDHMPIHLDEDVAKSVGLPRIIVHGLCTMAFASRAVVSTACGADAARLKRLAVRFSKPVLPGQEITTTIWAAGESNEHQIYIFETTNPEGDAVIKDGLAEVASTEATRDSLT